MTAWKPHTLPRLAVPCFLLLLLCAQSGALARGSVFLHDEPWSAERIDCADTRNLHALCSTRLCRTDGGGRLLASGCQGLWLDMEYRWI